LTVLAHDGKKLRERLRANVGAIPERLRGWNSGGVAGPGPIFSVAPKTSAAAERLRRRLLAAGIYPPLIRYPNGPAMQFFRFAVSTAHAPSQLQALADVLETFSTKEGEAQE
jgi:7-keto-8-aminopelargonate synthetase-like enzyme